MAASGVNPGTTRRDLDSLAAQTSTSGMLQQPTEWDPDTHKHIDQLQQQSTLKMISEGLERAQRNFDAYLDENVDINWEVQRKKIYEHFGLMPRKADAMDDTVSPGGKGSFGKSTKRSRMGNTVRSGQSTLNRSIFGQSSLQKSVIGSPGIGSGNALFADLVEKNGAVPATQDDRYLREKQRKLSEKVQALNQSRLQKARLRDRPRESSYPLLQEFLNVDGQSGGDVSRLVLP